MNKIQVVKCPVSKSDLDLVLNYAHNAKYNTKEDHIPLHDPLFSNNSVNFDLVTYGDMPREVVDVFDLYCKSVQKTVSDITGKEYDPPILGKSYISKYNTGAGIGMGFDPTRPENVFVAYVFWNSFFDGGLFRFKDYKLSIDLQPGDYIVFPETEEYSKEITPIIEGYALISQLWNAPKGQSPYPGLKYEDIYWGNPLWENI
jgi:hypothetical protein